MTRRSDGVVKTKDDVVGLGEELDQGLVAAPDRARAEPELAIEVDLTGLHLSEDLLHVASAIADRKSKIEALLATAASEREKVKDDIFERVTSDYRRQLEEIAAELGPVRHRIVEELRAVNGRERELRDALQRIRDSIDELNFRFRVGEFSEPELEELTAEQRGSVGSLEAQLAAVERTYATARGVLGEDVDALLAEAAAVPTPRRDSRGAKASRAVTTASPALPINTDSMPAQRIGPPPPPPNRQRSMAMEAPVNLSPPSLPEDFLLGPAPLEAPPPTSTSVMRKALLTRKRPDGGKTFVVDEQGLVIGRSTGSDIVIQGASVSRRHAVIQFSSGGFVIEDVSSGGGLLVNGEREAKTKLADGDQIEIGTSLFEFRID
jgi:hypothetical protein